MSFTAVAQKYAKALFEETQNSKTTAQIEKELFSIAQSVGADSLSFFENPFTPVADKLAVIKNTFENKVSAETLSFLNLLVEKNRLAALSEIATKYSELSKALVGSTKGKLFSPTEPSKDFIKNVEETLSKKLNQKVELEFHQDPSLIAGFKVDVGGWTIDDSAAAHLNKLKEDLMKRGL